MVMVVLNPLIVQNLLRMLLCNYDFQGGTIIGECFGPRHFIMGCVALVCLLLFYPIATIIYPIIVYSKFSTNKKKKAELTYTSTHLLALCAYKLLIGALTPLLSSSRLLISTRLNLNTLMLCLIVCLTIRKIPCIGSNTQGPHLLAFFLLALVKLSHLALAGMHFHSCLRVIQNWRSDALSSLGNISCWVGASGCDGSQAKAEDQVRD